VRINEVDIDPEVKDTADYIGCRIYMYKGRSYKSPPKEMITSAFKQLMKK
jgi:hypothetical protein